MEARAAKLRRLLALHGRLVAAHEAKRAGFLAAATAARAEAESVSRRFDAPDSLFALFPALYHDRVAAALRDEERALAAAKAEAEAVARLRARADVIDRLGREAEAWEERRRAERELLEWVSRPGAQGVPG